MQNEYKRNKTWNIKTQEPEVVSALCDALGIDALLAKLLYNRGYTDADQAGAFLRKETGVLHHPYLLHDMKEAVERIRSAVENREHITIYGDYDADGVTATSLLFLYLSRLGADVHYYIPDRFDEGYGLNEKAIRALATDGTKLIITVDTGVTALAEAALAAQLQMDLIITDHHTCRETLPKACAVINPRRPDDRYPFKALAGVGVAFKLICAMETYGMEKTQEKSDAILRLCRSYAEFAAIGTIADVMPLRDENRLLVNMGLMLMTDSKHPGVRALIDYTFSPVYENPANADNRIKKKKITSSFIAYTIAPRINAAGRISQASRAAALFLTESPEEANLLAASLCEANNERKETENRIAQEAFLQVEAEHDCNREHILILAGEGWHPGVIGIVASRVTEKYHLPSILFSFEQSAEDGISSSDEGKGSGRSIEGFCMIDALMDADDLLVRYGGHAQAAGMTIRREKLPEFRRRMEACAAKAFSEGVPPPILDIDCETAFYDITLRNAEALYQLEPFGEGNPQPEFCLRGVKIRSIVPLSAGKHTKLLLEHPENPALEREAVMFGQRTELFPYTEGDIVDVAYHMDVNEFRGDKRVQMLISDLCPSDPQKTAFAIQDAVYAQYRAGIAAITPNCRKPEEMIPTREECRALFLLLRAWTESGAREYPCTYTQMCYHTHLGRCKTRMICDIFTQTELIKRKKEDSDGFICVFSALAGKKIDLDAAPTMCMLRRLYQTSEAAVSE